MNLERTPSWINNRGYYIFTQLFKFRANPFISSHHTVVGPTYLPWSNCNAPEKRNVLLLHLSLIVLALLLGLPAKGLELVFVCGKTESYVVNALPLSYKGANSAACKAVVLLAEEVRLLWELVSPPLHFP